MSELSTAQSQQQAVAPTEHATLPLAISRQGWYRIGILTGLMVALFWPNLIRLYLKTNPITGEANWSHAMFVLPISIFYLYINRQRLREPSPTALSNKQRSLLVGGLVALGLLMLLAWVYVLASGLLLYAAAGVLLLIVLTMAGLWFSRDTAAADLVADTSATWFGVFFLINGVAFYAFGIYPGQNDYFKDMGMVATLMGMAIVLAGWARMKVAWFAVAFLSCAIPWPDQLYSQLAMPLQQLAANVAVWTLQLTAVDSFASGTKIIITGYHGAVRTLNVAQACAGLRSLMTFVTLGGAIGFLSSRPLWQKCVITFSAIPIAIFCNVLRISGQGLLDHYVSQQLAEGFAHQFVGLIMFIPAIFLILLVAWGLDQIFVEEADRRHKTAAVLRKGPAVTAVPVGVSGGPLSLRGDTAPKPAPKATTVTRRAPAAVAPPPPSVRLAPRSTPRPATKPGATRGFLGSRYQTG